MNAWDVVGFIMIWFAILACLIAVFLAVDLYVRLRIVRSELENALRKIEEIKRMNGIHEDQ